ncbi:MAG: hypothetical protein P1V36_11925 [Planctomycetota bacterium]|nr:hypothetical protein [Planctomycetota bacterium]
MVGSALRHFLEHAIDEHAATLDDAFPPCFDWHRICREAPLMAERVSEGAVDASDLETAETVQAQADVAVRITHVVALAVLCAAEDHIADPEAALEAFGEAPEEDEEERFAVLAAEVLGPAEAFFQDETVALDDRGVEAHRFFALAWPLASEYLMLSGLFGEVEGSDVEPAHESIHPVLAALARLAVLLATMRWMARYPRAA